jgi:hypothetical protein
MRPKPIIETVIGSGTVVGPVVSYVAEKELLNPFAD